MAAADLAAPWPVRVVRGHLRTSAAVLLGLLAYALLPLPAVPAARAVLAWDAGTVAFIALAVQLFVTGCRGDAQMARNAESQAEGEWTIFSVTLGGVVTSFVALTVVFSGVKDLPPDLKGLHVALVAATLLLSWLVTHVLFALRYAHEYYARDRGGPDIDRGLDFPSDEAPDYWDFMYFAIVIGMTFQVSDVAISARKLRRLAALHGLISFLFNTVIVALTVNIAASLL